MSFCDFDSNAVAIFENFHTRLATPTCLFVKYNNPHQWQTRIWYAAPALKFLDSLHSFFNSWKVAKKQYRVKIFDFQTLVLRSFEENKWPGILVAFLALEIPTIFLYNVHEGLRRCLNLF